MDYPTFGLCLNQASLCPLKICAKITHTSLLISENTNMVPAILEFGKMMLLWPGVFKCYRYLICFNLGVSFCNLVCYIFSIFVDSYMYVCFWGLFFCVCCCVFVISSFVILVRFLQLFVVLYCFCYLFCLLIFVCILC